MFWALEVQLRQLLRCPQNAVVNLVKQLMRLRVTLRNWTLPDPAG